MNNIKYPTTSFTFNTTTHDMKSILPLWVNSYHFDVWLKIPSASDWIWAMLIVDPEEAFEWYLIDFETGRFSYKNPKIDIDEFDIFQVKLREGGKHE